MKSTLRRAIGRRQSGAAVVEFALVSVVLLLLVIGIIEWGRVLFLWNTAVEATRSAARTAVVCDLDAAMIRQRITALAPQIHADAVEVVYLPQGCSATVAPLCEFVTVSLQPGAVQVQTLIPFVSFASIAMPTFSTTLTTESLQSSPGGVANPVCTR